MPQAQGAQPPSSSSPARNDDVLWLRIAADAPDVPARLAIAAANPLATSNTARKDAKWDGDRWVLVMGLGKINPYYDLEIMESSPWSHTPPIVNWFSVAVS